ncbi:MAG TPA: TonB-dependent receptor plug domain-containing protein, partial [Planctomycetota bacterium]|nr:TonB-dependent receptor plug domain-containing protein [Planctomycetota bacterium]
MPIRRVRRSLFKASLVALLSGAAEAQDAPSPGPKPSEAQDGTSGTADAPRADETVVTALRHPASAQDVPQEVHVVGEEQLRTGPDARSLPNAVTREPGVLVQKTGPGQSSPFIRGFTGFRTLLMVDGIRLNNSTFRDGPNQYFSTVDQFAIESLELVYGPSSVLWGSDAIGGALNALTGKAEAEDDWHGRYFVRWSSAERALFNRIEAEGGEEGSYALRVGVTDKVFGDIRAGRGSGELDGTSYDERDLDFRLDVPLGDEIELTFAGQHVQQNNVPRTHTTVDAVPFAGTAPGTDLQRDLDQTRDLLYGRLAWEGEGGLYDDARFTLSWQRQQEEQERLRTGGRKELLGLDVSTLGAQLEYEKDTAWGLLTWGVEDYHDTVDSWRRDFVNGVKTLDAIQGPVADDASYNLFGAYLQDEVVNGPYETVFGLRWSHATLDANRVDNPDVAGNNP